MTAKSRIAKIRLSEKLSRNPGYAEHIGVFIVNREADIKEKSVYVNRDKDYYKAKDGKAYGDTSRTVNC